MLKNQFIHTSKVAEVNNLFLLKFEKQQDCSNSDSTPLVVKSTEFKWLHLYFNPLGRKLQHIQTKQKCQFTVNLILDFPKTDYGYTYLVKINLL